MINQYIELTKGNVCPYSGGEICQNKIIQRCMVVQGVHVCAKLMVTCSIEGQCIQHENHLTIIDSSSQRVNPRRVLSAILDPSKHVNCELPHIWQ